MKNQIIYKVSQLLRKVGFTFHEEANFQVQEMKKTIADLGGIHFRIEVEKEGSWVAESTNIQGILTGGDVYGQKEVNTLIRDAIFTFFEIPPHLCNDQLVKANTERVEVAEKVYV